MTTRMTTGEEENVSNSVVINQGQKMRTDKADGCNAGPHPRAALVGLAAAVAAAGRRRSAGEDGLRRRNIADRWCALDEVTLK